MKMRKTEQGYEWSGPDSDGEIEIETHDESLWLTENDLREMLKLFEEKKQ